MRILDNIDRMGDRTYSLLSKGILLSAALLLIGCMAILQNNFPIADTCRDLSSTVLLITTVFSCYIAKSE